MSDRRAAHPATMIAHDTAYMRGVVLDDRPPLSGGRDARRRRDHDRYRNDGKECEKRSHGTCLLVICFACVRGTSQHVTVQGTERNMTATSFLSEATRRYKQGVNKHATQNDNRNCGVDVDRCTRFSSSVRTTGFDRHKWQRRRTDGHARLFFRWRRRQHIPPASGSESKYESGPGAL
jgi:hypothetical protein